MNSKNLCPICGEGHLHEQVDQVEVEYRGEKSLRNSLYSVCDTCGSETATAAQVRSNKRDTIAFRKRVDGLLTGAEVRAIREKLGINQAEAATIFGGGPVAFSKYENDDVMQSEAMDKLLRLSLEVPGVIEKLARDAGVDLIKEGVWQTLTNEKQRQSRPSLRIVKSSSVNPIGGWKNAS